MEETTKILAGYSEKEKTAYLGAIASIATADRQASEEEFQYIAALCDAADLAGPQKEAVLHAATDVSGKELVPGLDVLKNSELRYSLVTDLIAFAKADENYSEEEEENIEKIAEYLNVNQHQYALLDQFADKTLNQEVPVDEEAQPGFLSSLGGLKDKLQNEGISGSALLKGLIGLAGPIILGKMLSGRRQSTSGGLGGLLGGGGLGSLIGMLSGGRQFGNTGAMLKRILGRGGHL